MDKEQLGKIIEETYHFLSKKDVSFICYIWDREGNHAGGCRAGDTDEGDAIVVITKIIKRFNIDQGRLFVALTDARLGMEEN